MEGVTCFCLSKILCNGALLSAPSTMSLVKNCGLNNIRASCRWRALFIQFGEDMTCFSYRGGGWSTICSRKLKVSLFFFSIFQISRQGPGGGGGTLMSLYTESQKIKLLYCLNAVSYFKEKYCYWPKKPSKQNNLEWYCS